MADIPAGSRYVAMGSSLAAGGAAVAELARTALSRGAGGRRVTLESP
ncbi:MAG: hypothetical protein JWL68_1759 [Actinomycetia bacterium]|nr:hypothetical protein [Actinomycetes bacterium]